jgi:hypothetical protein
VFSYPGIIEAATSIFAGQAIREMTQADASNLQSAAARLIDIIVEARQTGKRAVAFLTGVPGSGKTLAGLRVVHDAVTTGAENRGDIVYLSGNTPLVTVLREALALDEEARQRAASKLPRRERIRREVRTRIQHINEFLKSQLHSSGAMSPHEHVIVFDEAQRAWDAGQGEKKFGRKKSEPELILEIMGSHQDWCVCVCLIGSGQEINDGELGIQGWYNALAASNSDGLNKWAVYAPTDLFEGSRSPYHGLFDTTSASVAVNIEPDLALRVPMRMFRAPEVSNWVGLVLSGDIEGAEAAAERLGDYKILITRSLQTARLWLRSAARGDRRYGLVASSGARRLRADGLGQILSATDGDSIAHWYLKPPGDIRSSYALEVPANEYTCQGLELDFVAVCWGGDLIWQPRSRSWAIRRFMGDRWNRVSNDQRRRFIQNKYRVLLTRAREGIVIWVPMGDEQDSTRDPNELQSTFDALTAAGATPI